VAGFQKRQLGGEHGFDVFAVADQAGLAVFDQHFGGAGAGVVVAGHARSVGAGAVDQQQIAFGSGDGAVFGEKVAALAHGADDVGSDFRLPAAGEGFDAVVGLVQGGAH